MWVMGVSWVWGELRFYHRGLKMKDEGVDHGRQLITNQIYDL